MPTETKHILALGDNSQSIYRDFLKGLHRYSRLHGCQWVLYINSPGYVQIDLSEVTAQNIRRWKIHGIVDYLSNPSKTKEFVSMGLPCVSINNGPQKQILGPHVINVDNTKIGEMGARYLIRKKFLNFAYCGFSDTYWSQERNRAFADTITAEGLSISVYEEPYDQVQDSWKKELPCLARWLKSLPKPIGLMACSDKRAQHVLEACYIANLDVPEDIAVIGVDNDDFFCELNYPPLSSISINTENIGYHAGHILDRSLKGENLPPQELLFEPTTIIERESTEVLAIYDEMVKEAARFIRLNRMEHISATEVAEAVGTCIRTLDRRFKKSLGRPVHSEIMRVRIQQACHMLVNSNLSITQIAYKL